MGWISIMNLSRRLAGDVPKFESVLDRFNNFVLSSFGGASNEFSVDLMRIQG